MSSTTTKKTLADEPPVAATISGGPAEHPGLFVQPKRFQYEVVQGFFVQSGPNPKQYDFEHMLEHNFGMIDSSLERWTNLKRDVANLQAEAAPGVQYKVFFLGRHGEGWHNYAAAQIGIEPWEAKWAMEYGNGTITWGPDPELTPKGVSQAKAIQECWRKQAPLGAPITKDEMRWFVSPLTRTGQTMLYSWGDMLVGTPEVWEDLREIYGSHTCDLRRSKTYIQETFPSFLIEEGLTEDDELWKPDERETEEHMQIRGQRALDRIFGPGGAKETYISITAHSGNLRNFMAVLRHQPYPLATGEMIPVVVRATPTGANDVTGDGLNHDGSISRD